MPTLAKLSYQMLKALQFIHELGICHCDVKPENICMVSASRNKFKLIDFGAATLEYDYRNSYVQSRWYRAPEVMLGLPWDEKVDVWSLGCVLVELVVGRPIFYGPAVEYVLAAQTAVLGDIPDRMMRASSLTRMYYTPDRQLYTVDPQGYPNGVYLIQPMHTSLKELLGSFPHVDNDFIDFVGRLLQFDPARRLSSSEAFDHPWVQAQAEGDQEKNFRMSDLRVSGFRHSELVPSQNASPNGSRDCTPVIPRGPSQVDSLRHSSLSNKDEGSFGAKTGGPGVPEDFRNQLASDRSRSSGEHLKHHLRHGDRKALPQMLFHAQVRISADAWFGFSLLERRCERAAKWRIRRLHQTKGPFPGMRPNARRSCSREQVLTSSPCARESSHVTSAICLVCAFPTIALQSKDRRSHLLDFSTWISRKHCRQPFRCFWQLF
mmetsp:Transcript_62051/g.109971  ORF Transcript_62051/g.109971 Transcript_62051/m.109971 type:complete len:434 (-) Transcript_62051:112-1413(-)